MKKVDFESSEKNVEKPLFFLVVAILLVGSLTMLAIGLTKSKHQTDSDSPKNEAENIAIEKDGVSVSQFFEGEFSESNFVEDDEFIKDDPFREKCADVSGDGLPSVSFNTVCLR